MNEERFVLVPSENLMWKVTDKQSGISVEFREGLFNETQKIETPDKFKSQDEALAVATHLREIGEWLKENHEEVAVCNLHARCRAIWNLANEKYWIALAGALNGLLVNWEPEKYAMYLKFEIDDYLAMEDKTLNAAEKSNLLGAVSMLSAAEAMEVVYIVYAFWKHCEQKEVEKWASDLLWWPAWLSKEQQEDAANEVDELDEEKGIEIENGGDNDPLDGVDFK